MIESEDIDETADNVVELARSPASVRSPTSPAQRGNVDDVFLFDNNIPSISTRIPTSAEPTDMLALRRRNRLLRLISGPRGYSSELQRSLSVQLDDRRRHRYHSDDLSDGLSTSWANGGINEHLPQRHTQPNGLNDDDDADDDDNAEVDVQRQDGGGRTQPRGRGRQNCRSLTNGSDDARRRR